MDGHDRPRNGLFVTCVFALNLKPDGDDHIVIRFEFDEAVVIKAKTPGNGFIRSPGITPVGSRRDVGQTCRAEITDPWQKVGKLRGDVG